ncbi:hypothetical protein Fcan01_04606 [Folsomia candida]|uniref:Uncharacterized protein n=1 Tax=Folsomia candida TaxID=158441 RepID=A0A226ER38_FOLCA|nr:hypothetical protein Fcan01_04606 [Folsomia candida]
MNAQLEKELARLNQELTKVMGYLDEEVQLRSSLECQVMELKKAINTIDQELCVVIAERDQLCMQIEDTSRRLELGQQSLLALQCERDELYQNLTVHQSNAKKTGGLQNDLKQGLADCCARVDELTKQIGCLHAEVNKANRERDDLLRERDELLRKLDCLREKYETSKCLNDQIIEKLHDQVKCLETQQASSCQKYTRILQAHHVELDRINAEKMRLEDLYAEEKGCREDLERKLRDCEEQKRKARSGSGGGGPWGGGGSGPGGPGPGGRGGGLFGNQNPNGNDSNSLPPQSPPKCDQYKADIQRLEWQKEMLEKSKTCLEQQVIQLSNINTQISLELEKALIKPVVNDFGQSTDNYADEIDQYKADIQSLEKEKEMLTESRKYLEQQVADLLNNNSQISQELKSLQENVQEKAKESENVIKPPPPETSDFSGQTIQIQDDFVTDDEDNNNYEEDKEDEYKSQIQRLEYDLAFEKQQHYAFVKNAEKDKQTFANLTSMKDKIESEVIRLREAISNQFVERTDLNQLKDSYEIQLTHLQNKFEAQLEMNRQLAEINEQLGKQFKDRDLINSIRDSNEELLRKELSSVINASKCDADKLRRIIDDRNEEVASLRKLISHLKHKYVSAAHKNDKLLKKVQILASTSRENFLEMDSETETNNNI